MHTGTRASSHTLPPLPPESGVAVCGSWHPLTPSWVPLLAVLFGVYVSPETYSFGFFWVWICCRIVRLSCLDSGYSSCVSLRCFLVQFHIYQRDGGLWEITCGECFLFSAMLGSSVDTIFAAVYEAFAAPRTWQSLVRCCMLLISARKC